MPASVFSKLTQDQFNELTRKQSLQFEQMADAIGALPGVERVGGVNVLPLGSTMVSISRKSRASSRPLPQNIRRRFSYEKPSLKAPDDD